MGTGGSNHDGTDYVIKNTGRLFNQLFYLLFGTWSPGLSSVQEVSRMAWAAERKGLNWNAFPGLSSVIIIATLKIEVNIKRGEARCAWA
jgi:hypothetical protein